MKLCPVGLMKYCRLLQAESVVEEDGEVVVEAGVEEDEEEGVEAGIECYGVDAMSHGDRYGLD